MQEDFHYYATYCAAFLAGYSHSESLDICYSAQFVDMCTKTLLTKLKGDPQAATTQLQLELADTKVNLLGIQDMTRIWSSFHFLPYDLYAVKPKRPRRYLDKYRLICKPNGELVAKTVMIARDKSLQHVGISMHVLADTWAHSYFAGTPSQVINNTTDDFYEIVTDAEGCTSERKIRFRHNPAAQDDLEKSIYTNTVHQDSEKTIMNLGHGRAGHLPDYSFAKYRYMPVWDDYREVIKDNPEEYLKAFKQMIYAMKYLRGVIDDFTVDTYDEEAVAPYIDRIRSIIGKRQLSASGDWKKFGEELSGKTIDDFDIDRFQDEYMNAPKDAKDSTFIGKFIKGALAQKSMVTHEIITSGNRIAGFVNYRSFLRKEGRS